MKTFFYLPLAVLAGALAFYWKCKYDSEVNRRVVYGPW